MLCPIADLMMLDMKFMKIQVVILVSAKEDLRIKRVMKRDSMGRDEVKELCAIQNEALMRRISKVEWKNEGSETALKKTRPTRCR